MLEFYDYREPIPYKTIMDVLSAATSSALKHQDDSLIDTGQLGYWGDGVHLILYPEPDMKWQMWRNAVVGMKKFVKLKQMSYGWSFIVMNKGTSSAIVDESSPPVGTCKVLAGAGC